MSDEQGKGYCRDQSRLSTEFFDCLLPRPFQLSWQLADQEPFPTIEQIADIEPKAGVQIAELFATNPKSNSRQEYLPEAVTFRFEILKYVTRQAATS